MRSLAVKWYNFSVHLESKDSINDENTVFPQSKKVTIEDQCRNLNFSTGALRG